MRLSCDRTGFPLLEWSEAGLEVALLPVTKAQFERFLAEPNEFGNAWYEQVLALNPRVSWRQFGPEERERLFLTGVLPEEALAFLRWLGGGFDLPTVEEWRAMDRWLRAAPLDVEALTQCPLHRSAQAIVRGLLRQSRPRVWGELALLRGGVVEWVREGRGFGGLGAPRPGFHPNTWNPQRDAPVRPLRAEARLPYFGFRCVRRWHERQQEEEEDLW